MKESIDSIIAIDNKTKEMVNKTNKEIFELREDLQKRIIDMENKTLEQAKDLAKSKYNEITKSFEDKASLILSENRKKLKKVEDDYNKEENHLIDKAIKIILDEDDYE
ncbi:hypothetical protein HMPREF2134_13855 [Peptoniphilus lacrimalis DNF00528]|uniref:Uncharacterized protein n=1 Tax=Peptoniphilus lacrimalis 315-B TaxID=596330 RepID=D1VUR0_9FIRM|nr:hypothetical protein [Peptoniphilus lacrimalis]EFA89791.1 hypothetical protein HMPREF0628_0562 [Peptoniphilus lacrimalis 315-B]KGF30815.1 hypothetical protein HMPREF2134_13855 [Peptoniphilus lacrimalis DNF00528]